MFCPLQVMRKRIFLVGPAIEPQSTAGVTTQSDDSGHDTVLSASGQSCQILSNKCHCPLLRDFWTADLYMQHTQINIIGHIQTSRGASDVSIVPIV